MNYLSIKKPDVANGPGIRVSIFVSGCPHHCKGCFNVESWDWNAGEPYTLDTLREITDFLQNSYVSGITLLGGEPFAQDGDIESLCEVIKREYPDKTIWAYSGYTFEALLEKNHSLLKYIDVLVDGRFIESLKDLRLRFRGSSNQRIIDVPKSLEKKDVVLWTS